jgi:hypothetical protein
MSIHKHGRFNIIIPDMNKYRPAQPEDRKKPGDLFNIGKWESEEDKYIRASCPNGKRLGPWHKYYLIRK